MGFLGFPPMFSGFHWFTWISINLHGFPQIFNDCHWFPQIFKDFSWFSLMFDDFQRFPVIFRDLHWFSPMFNDLYGFPLIFTDFHGFQRSQGLDAWRPVAACGSLWQPETRVVCYYTRPCFTQEIRTADSPDISNSMTPIQMRGAKTYIFWVSIDFRGFPWISIYVHLFSLISMDCH